MPTDYGLQDDATLPSTSSTTLDGIVDDVAPAIEPVEPDLAMEAGVFDDLDIVG